MHMWIMISISRANTRRPARRKCRVAPSRPCRRLVTLPTAGRSRSLSAGYGCLRTIQQKQITHSLSWLHLLQLFFSVLQNVYKAKYEKEKGKSIYNLMTVPPDVQHAMDVAKNQSNVRHLRCRRVPENLLLALLILLLLSHATGFIQEGC